jgi:hypothetical protein
MADIHCRVLLTTPLESFIVGDTIIISRGLIDVVPSESALALILAHQLSHKILGHATVDSRFGFADVLRISDAEILALLRFQHPDDEETEADTKAMELLEKSPYSSTAKDGALFLQALQQGAARLPYQIQPHFGEHVADVKKVVADGRITREAPVLNDEVLDQTAALPLGSRLVLNPWNDHLDLLETVSLVNPVRREGFRFGVGPLMQYPVYYSDTPAMAPTLITTKPVKIPSAVRPKAKSPVRHSPPATGSTARVSTVSADSGSGAKGNR